MRFGLFEIWLVFVILAMSTTSMADEKVDDAKAAFEAGRKLYEQQKFVEAAAEFKMANKLSPNWKLYYNIGQSEASAKHHGLALEAFESYLSQGGDDIDEIRLEELQKEMKRLKQIVGYLEIAAPDGSAVLVDGLQRGTAPLVGPILVAAGVNHQVAVVLEGEELLGQTVRISGDKTMKLTAEDEPETVTVLEEPVASPEPAPVAPKGNKLKTAGWITLGTGAATLIAASVTGAMAFTRNNDLEGRCPEDACAGSDWEEADKNRKLGVATDIMFGIGGAVAATGIILLVVGARKEKNAVSVTPVASAGFAAALFGGRF